MHGICLWERRKMHFFNFFFFLEVGKIFSSPPPPYCYSQMDLDNKISHFFETFSLSSFIGLNLLPPPPLNFPQLQNCSPKESPPFVSLLPSSIKSVDAVPGCYFACLSKLFDMRPFPMIMGKHSMATKKLWKRMQKEDSF